jgi:hypothetical protein
MLEVNESVQILSSDGPADKFRRTSEQISLLLNKEGVPAPLPFHDESLVHFKALSNKQQQTAIRNIGNHLKILEYVVKSGESLKNEQQILWRALKLFNMRPKFDIFSFLDSKYAIELYDCHGIQLWSNIRFMEVCSYTLEEMFCYSWQDRYKRDEEATGKILKVLDEMLISESPQTVRPQIENRLIESFSTERFIIDVVHDYMSPVMGAARNMVGFLVLSTVEVVGKEEFHEIMR